MVWTLILELLNVFSKLLITWKSMYSCMISVLPRLTFMKILIQGRKIVKFYFGKRGGSGLCVCIKLN